MFFEEKGILSFIRRFVSFLRIGEGVSEFFDNRGHLEGLNVLWEKRS
jgi:hypothetical protein